MSSTQPLESIPLPVRPPLFAAISLGLISTVVVAVLPALVGAWQREFGLNAGQSGWVAAAELFAQVSGTIAFLRLGASLDWRRCAVLGLGLMIAGNLGCVVSTSFRALLLNRLLAGAGGGLVRALAMNCLGRDRNPGRAFAVYASGQVVLAGLVTAGISAVLARAGIGWVFGVLAGACALALLLVPGLPRALDRSALDGDPRTVRRWSIPSPAILCLAGLFVFFVGQAAVWTYLAPLGRAQGISADAIAATLTAINVAGFAGTLVAGAIAGRSDALAIVAALIGVTFAALLVLFHTRAGMPFAFGACLFYFAWCVSLPLQFALIAASDVTGRAAAAAPAVDGLGLACGAALGGALITHVGLDSSGILCAGASAAAVAAYGFARRLRARPAAAAG